MFPGLCEAQRDYGDDAADNDPRSIDADPFRRTHRFELRALISYALAPAAHHLAERCELTEVVAVVIAHNRHLAKYGVARCSLQDGEQVDRLVRADPLQGAQVVVELLDSLAKASFIRFGVLRRPVLDWPARRNVPNRILAVAKDVPLGDADVLQDVPRRVLDVGSTLIHRPGREIRNRIVEAHVGLGSAQLVDQHPALRVHVQGVRLDA